MVLKQRVPTESIKKKEDLTGYNMVRAGSALSFTCVLIWKYTVKAALMANCNTI